LCPHHGLTNLKKIFNKIITIADYKCDKSVLMVMDELLYKIYLLDIEKGTLEKDYANAIFNESIDCQIKKIKERLVDVVNTHSKYVCEIELLRQAIINEIEQIVF
jgi:hypothetical protein